MGVRIEHVFSCRACGAEIGRTGAQDIGSPLLRCACGVESYVDMLCEWDHMSSGRRADLWFGRLWGFGGPAALLGFLGSAAWFELIQHQKHQLEWPFPALYYIVAPGLLGMALGAFLLRRDIAASRKRLKDPAYAARIEAMRPPKQA